MAEEKRVFKDPVDWDQLYPGRFLKAGEFLGKKPTLTMTAVKLDELEGTKGKQIKGIIHFKEVDKALALNKTNGICIKAMFGKVLKEWIGKRVTLYAAPYEGDEAIRVWGSPDIPADMVDIAIELPRKRPFKMTMHKVLPKSAQAPTNNETTGGDDDGQ
jgi:hypothetical protein